MYITQKARIQVNQQALLASAHDGLLGLKLKTKAGDASGFCVRLPTASVADSSASWLDDVLPTVDGRLCSQPLLQLLAAVLVTTEFGRVVFPPADIPLSLLRKAGTMGRELSLCKPDNTRLSSTFAAAGAMLLTECSSCRAFLAPVFVTRITVATTYNRFSTNSSTPTAPNPAALATLETSMKYKHPVAVATTANLPNTCRATQRSDVDIGLCTQAALLTYVHVTFCCCMH